MSEETIRPEQAGRSDAVSKREFTSNEPIAGIPLPCEASIFVDVRGKLTILATDLHRPGELETLLRVALARLEDHHRWSLKGE